MSNSDLNYFSITDILTILLLSNSEHIFLYYKVGVIIHILQMTSWLSFREVIVTERINYSSTNYLYASLRVQNYYLTPENKCGNSVFSIHLIQSIY